mgnify:CR=1 FL=1
MFRRPPWSTPGRSSAASELYKRQLVDKLNKLTVKIGAKAGETGKIFGSVNSIQLAEAIQAAGHDVERKQITLSDDTIKELGSYEAKVKVYKDIFATVKFDVVAD